MAMVIANNVSSLTAQHQLSRSSHGLARSLERLSSGLRVNRGADDPAALAVVACAKHCGLKNAQIQAAFDTFKGIRRRMEVRGISGGVTVLDDFGHHPSAILGTLEALRLRFSHQKLWALTGGIFLFEYDRPDLLQVVHAGFEVLERLHNVLYCVQLDRDVGYLVPRQDIEHMGEIESIVLQDRLWFVVLRGLQMDV